MTLNKLTLMPAAVLLALACGRGDESFTDSTPDMDGLALEISNQAAEGVTTSGLQAGPVGQSSSGVTTVPEFLQHARDAVKELNDMVRRAIGPVVGLISKGGRIQPGDTREYGPRDQDGATWRLIIKRIAINKFAWRLDAKPLLADDTAYLAIMGGAVQVGRQAHRGIGIIGINLDNLKLVLGATFNGQGKLLAAFAHVEEGDGGTQSAKALAYVLAGFTPDTTVHDPTNAAFVGYKFLPSNLTGIRLLAQADLQGTATTAKENIALRVRWIPAVGGAAAVHAWGGDIPVGTWYRGFACWDATEQEGFKLLQSCSGSPTPTCTDVAGYPVGQLVNCQPSLGQADVLEPQDSDVNSTAQETGAPDLADPLTPPADVPDAG